MYKYVAYIDKEMQLFVRVEKTTYTQAEVFWV